MFKLLVDHMKNLNRDVVQLIGPRIAALCCCSVFGCVRGCENGEMDGCRDLEKLVHLRCGTEVILKVTSVENAASR